MAEQILAYNLQHFLYLCLCMNVICAILISSGKIPWVKQLLNIYLSGSTIKSKTLLIALKDIPT